MQKSTFSVNFFIRRTRLGKSGETPIMMRISVDGRYTELSTQRRVLVDQWSQSRCCATGKTAVALEINRHLDNLRSKASEAHQNFLAEDGYVDPFIIKEFLLGKHRRQRFFFEVFEEHNARIASLIGKDYDRTTYHRYMLCLRYFREMMAKQTKAEDFPIRNLSHEMVRDFEHFLKTKKRVAQNTMIRYMKCLKKVVNLSLANGWMTVNPFAGIKYAEKKVIREYLTMPEVNRLREKEFSIQRLEMVRDIFLFCCYTGLAYIDVHNLRPENITEDAHGRKWIRKQREKTDVEFYVPLLEYPLQILEKYKNHPLCKERGTLLPVYANQKMNSYLKEIADFCGIKKQLTMHIARYTFATTITLANDVKLENVSKMLGHTSTRMTQHYAHVMNDSLAREMDRIAPLVDCVPKKE